MQFFGWLNNWPLIRLIQAPLAIIYVLAVAFGMVILVGGLIVLAPFFAVLLAICVVIGLIIGVMNVFHDRRERKVEEELQEMANAREEGRLATRKRKR